MSSVVFTIFTVIFEDLPCHEILEIGKGKNEDQLAERGRPLEATSSTCSKIPITVL